MIEHRSRMMQTSVFLCVHPYCSPSRAGLLTGRYQQRFGHECNPGASEDDVESGLPVGETLISNTMQSGGYRTVAIGKWHLGDAKRSWPTERGFDEWFGFTGEGLSYWGTAKKNRPLSGVLDHASNLPLRGHKGMLSEGGIRVPFCVSWPKELPSGVRYQAPVSALDIFPTVLAACEVESAVESKLDGVNLLPFMKGENKSRPHQTMFWRFAMGNDVFGYAVRDGDDKLIVKETQPGSRKVEVLNH